MTVAIFGSGKMGGGLARLLASKGFDIAIGHRDPGKAVALADDIGAKARGGNLKDAVSQADIILLAVRYQDAAEALKAAGDLTNKIVVDISNPITADYKGLTIGHSTSAAEEIQKLAPGAKVVKAFNTIFAELLPKAERAARSKCSSPVTMRRQRQRCRTSSRRWRSNRSIPARSITRAF